MEIPYTVHPRSDTGLTNPKLGIWLFIASEVMLFGGLFAGYIFMRLGAEPWMWPHGWLNVPVGTFNTFILIFSSVTIILSWEALKMRKYKMYKMWLALTWICGLAFLGVKLGKEWPDKFHHFGAYIKPEKLHKYEAFLGNENRLNPDGKPMLDKDGNPMLGRRDRGVAERRFISGHVLTETVKEEEEKAAKGGGEGHGEHPAGPRLEGEWAKKSAGIPYVSETSIDQVLTFGERRFADAETERKAAAAEKNESVKQTHLAYAAKWQAVGETQRGQRKGLLESLAIPSEDADALLKPDVTKETKAMVLAKINTIHLHEIDIENEKPFDEANDNPHFELTHESVVKHGFTLDKEDLLPGHGAWLPRLNTYLASYFMITGLHGAHVLGGSLVFIYFWLNIKGGSKLYHTNHQQLVNRIECAGLFWHLVDLIWIFVFPIFYLL